MYFNVKCTVLKSNAQYLNIALHFHDTNNNKHNDTNSNTKYEPLCNAKLLNALDLNILNLVRKSEIFVWKRNLTVNLY